MALYLARYETPVFTGQADRKGTDEGAGGCRFETDIYAIPAKNFKMAEKLATEKLPELRRRHGGYTSMLAELIRI